jgi:hypothetical protein
MALSKSALSELLDALRAGGDLDVIREGLALVLQALIDAEATQHIEPPWPRWRLVCPRFRGVALLDAHELETELRAMRRAMELVREVVPPKGGSRRSR